MKISQQGFVGALVLVLIAFLLFGGGAYLYSQTKQTDQPSTGGNTLSQATSTKATGDQTLSDTSVLPIISSVDRGAQGPQLNMTTYAAATPDERSFLDMVIIKYGDVFSKESLILFYFDASKGFAVVGTPGKGATEEYARDNFIVGTFQSIDIPGPSVSAPRELSSRDSNLFTAYCKNASSLNSSCLYVTGKDIVLFVDQNSEGTGAGSIFHYRAGKSDYDRDLLAKASSFALGGSYVKEYDATMYTPVYGTSFDGETITATLYKDNQSLGMGYYDLSKQNVKLRTLTFPIAPASPQ